MKVLDLLRRTVSRRDAESRDPAGTVDPAGPVDPAGLVDPAGPVDAPGETAEAPAGAPLVPEWRAALQGGATAAGISLLAVLAIAGVAGPLAPRASIDWGATVGVGSALWLLVGGARLSADGATIAFTPLLGTALLVIVGLRVGRRSLPVRGPRRLPYAAWLGGWAGVVLVAALVTLPGPVHPIWWSLLGPGLVVPAAVLATIEAGRGRLDDLRDRLPAVVRDAARPALETALAFVGVGIALVLLAVVWHASEVSHLHGQLKPGLLGGALLVVGQLLALPNVGLWAVSLLNGPGYALSEGAYTSLDSSTSGLLPLIPLLGAQPQPGEFGWYAWLLLLVPILIGGYGAQRALARLPRLAELRKKAGVVAVSIVGAALLIGLVDGAAGGALGDGRLSSVGAPALSMAFMAMLLMGIGASVVVLRDWWKFAR